MRLAAAEEFQAVPDVEVVMGLDPRFASDAAAWETSMLDGRTETLVAAARRCDVTLLIAPETGGVLEGLVRTLEDEGVPTLNSRPDAVAVCGHKVRLADHLTAAGIRVPESVEFDPARSGRPAFDLAVVKPVDGAGSVETYRVDVDSRRPAQLDPSLRWMIQPYQHGNAMSASYLVDGSGEIALLAVGRQEVEVIDGRFTYLGGRLPESREFGTREPLNAVRSVNGLKGFVGVDFVASEDGETLTVLEINPRLTTSFVALRRLVDPGTIAEAWLGTGMGRKISETFRRAEASEPRRIITFSADGRVTEGLREDR